MSERIDLGDGHSFEWLSWSPDRELNPQYAGIPDDPKIGAIVYHTSQDGKECVGAIRFDTPVHRQIRAAGGTVPMSVWTVESWEPLTLSPSLHCRCGDHGWIKEGKWRRA